MKKLKYLLFILPLLFIENVFALEYDVTSSITSPQGQGRIGTYTGLEIYNSGSNNVYNVNTRYNGQLSQIVYNIPLPDNWEDGSCFSTNVDYTVAMYMATDDWRNNFSTVTVKNSLSPSSNWSNGNVTFVSMKKIYFTFKIPTSESGSCYDSFLVTLNSNNLSNQPFTGVSNWNLSKVTITDPTTSSGGGSSGGGSSGSTNQDIINSSNQNTENIINNNNQNTQDIINNQNENNQNIINGIDNVNQQLGTCYKNLLKNIYYVNADSNTYLGNNDTVYQYEADTYSSPRNLKLQTYSNSGNLLSQSDYTPSLSVGRFNFSFTYTEDISYLASGINGAVIDTKFKIPLENLDLEPNSVYTLSYNVTNATNGSVQFKYFSLVKGNYTSNVSIDYGKSLCTSKLDNVTDSINSGTSNVIDNQNQNTQDIINNQNSNTQQIIDSGKVCQVIDKSNIEIDNSFLNNSGIVIDSPNGQFGITGYISLYSNSLLKVVNTSSNSVPGLYYCFYNSNKVKISCVDSRNLSNGQVIDIPDNVFYVRFSIYKNINMPSFSLCKNGNQVITDSITDSNVDNGTGTDFFDDFTSQDFGLSQIVTIPLNTIQSLTSKTCSPLQIPIPFTNSNVTLPCMTELYETKFPTIYNLWKIVSFGIIAYLISIDIFHIVKGFKDPESDKVEVLDL